MASLIGKEKSPGTPKTSVIPMSFSRESTCSMTVLDKAGLLRSAGNTKRDGIVIHSGGEMDTDSGMTDLEVTRLLRHASNTAAYIVTFAWRVLREPCTRTTNYHSKAASHRSSRFGQNHQRIEIKQIDFAPSQGTGLHNHPCPVVGYIARGSVNFQVEGEPPKTLHEGDAFFEPPDKTILHFENASDTDLMTFIAFYLLDENDRELIRMLE